ncbi:hypothetical protein HDG33_007530 [Paraburkholderia sp. Cpub6]|nr:hypothetical protein [Paraburkholderia sp. Cpub6]
MTTGYVVKTGENFLCTAEDGDIGMAPEIKEATSFSRMRMRTKSRTSTPTPDTKSWPSTSRDADEESAPRRSVNEG